MSNVSYLDFSSFPRDELYELIHVSVKDALDKMSNEQLLSFLQSDLQEYKNEKARKAA
jgi:hypothetical protein